MENSFLILKLERFTFKLKQQFLAPKKVYCVDTGVINMIGFRFSENIGRLMENTIAIELQRRKFLNTLLETYYWKDYQQREVDFVVKQGTKVEQLIQVTYATDKEEIEDREIEALIKASSELNCTNLLVISWDYEAEEKIRGKMIKFTPLWKWLLT